MVWLLSNKPNLTFSMVRASGKVGNGHKLRSICGLV